MQVYRILHPRRPWNGKLETPWALDACSLDRILLITEHLLGAHLQGITPSLPDLSFLAALKDVRVTLLWHRRSMRIPLVTVPRTPGSPALRRTLLI